MQLQTLNPDAAAIQAGLIRRKIAAAAAVGGGEEPFDRRLIEVAMRSAVTRFFGEISGEVAFAFRRASAPELSRIGDYACWCAFETEGRPIVIALDDATTLAAAHAALGKGNSSGKGEQASGVDRFIAAVLAKRLAAALAAAEPDAMNLTVGKRLALASAYSELRLEGDDGVVDLFEFSQLTISNERRLRFLIACPPLVGREVAVTSDEPARRRAAVSERLSRHALAAQIKLVARLPLARMTFSEAAALRAGDIIQCGNTEGAIDLTLTSTGGKPLFDGTMGRLDEIRAVRIARPSRGDEKARPRIVGDETPARRV